MARRQRGDVRLDTSGLERGLERREQRGVRNDALARLVAKEAKQEEIRVETDTRNLRAAEIDRLSEALKTEKNPEAIKSMGGRLNVLNTQLFGEGSHNIDFDRIAGDAETLKQFQSDFVSFDSLERRLGEKDPTVLQVFDSMRIKYGAFPGKLKEIQGVIEPTALETAVATEERGLATAGTLIEKRSAAGISELQERSRLGQAAITTEQNRLNTLLDQAGISGEQKSKILLGMSAGAGAGVEGALFPKDEEVVRFMPTFNDLGDQVGSVPIKTFTDPKTGKFVFEVAEKFVPEALAAEQTQDTQTPAEASVQQESSNVNRVAQSVAQEDLLKFQTFINDFKEKNEGFLSKELSEQELQSILSLFEAAKPKITTGSEVKEKTKKHGKSIRDTAKETGKKLGKQLRDSIKESLVDVDDFDFNKSMNSAVDKVQETVGKTGGALSDVGAQILQGLKGLANIKKPEGK